MTSSRPDPAEEKEEFVLREDFGPVRVLHVELEAPIPAIEPCTSALGQRYGQALSLVWLHQRPLGLVEIAIPDSGLTKAQHAQAIWARLAPRIAAHLQEDGLAPIDRLDPLGICSATTPRCQTEVKALQSRGPFVSVVVPTHNRPEQIATCVASLLRLDYPHFEIIVVDNGPSTSATADVIRGSYGENPRVRYVCEAQPSTSRARNRGIELARGEITAFCDDDVRHHRRWLTELVRGFDAGTRVGCVTGLVLPQELETPAQLWIEQYGGYSKGFAPRIFDLQDHAPQDRLFPFTTGRLGTGANMAFRTSVLRAIGGFDPALGGGSPAIGGEDLALSFQVIAAGYQLVYQPAAVVYHPHYREYAALCRQIHGYGVGLTAYLTKCVIDHPRFAIEILRRLPLGLAYVLSPRSPKNRKKSPSYPRELTMIELKGMARGPVAYLRGRWQQSHRRSLPTSPGEHGGTDTAPDVIIAGPDQP